MTKSRHLLWPDVMGTVFLVLATVNFIACLTTGDYRTAAWTVIAMLWCGATLSYSAANSILIAKLRLACSGPIRYYDDPRAEP